MNNLKKQVIATLKKIPDPELGISLYDLGLIYDVTIKGSHAEILMTLTTIGCPLFSMIEKDVRYAVRKIPGIKDVTIELTFEPPWGPEKMSKEAQEVLGF